MSDQNNDGAGKVGVTEEEVNNKIAKAIESLKVKNGGSADGALFQLYTENYKLRDERRELSAKIPADGATVLTGEDAADWAKFRGLGKFSDVNKLVAEGRTATARLSDIERTEQYQALGKAAGMNPAVFARLAKQDGIELVKKEAKGDDGKPVERVFVKGEGDATTPIEHYAAEKWAEFAPALKADGRAAEPNRPGTPPPNDFRTPPPPPGEGRHNERVALLKTGRYNI